MADFRSFQSAVRHPANLGEPVVDPAGWRPGQFSDVATWAYRITEDDAAELSDAVAFFRGTGAPIEDVNRINFPLAGLGDVLTDVRRELLDGRGMVMLQGFPVERLDREAIVIAYLGMGSYLGEKMVQNGAGHVLGHVTDTGGSYETSRGYNSRAELRFHADSCDYVGLLCLKTAKSGGESRVASSVTIYNRILEHRPDLIEVLCQNFHRAHLRDASSDEGRPWFKQPIFSFVDGVFSAISAGSTIEKAQLLPGVPRHTPEQKEALQVYRDAISECALDIPFVPGDIQVLNNHVILHSRRGFEDWPERDRKRHLLRLWLKDVNGRSLPKSQRERWSEISDRGVRPMVPLDVRSAA